MKMKKGLLMVVLLLAVSSVMAAMSFSTASVSNDMSVSLADTQDALLALDASDEHAAATVDHITADMLNINLDKGNGGEFGVQPDSTYTWDDLFEVTNNSEHKVDVTVTIPNAKSRINLLASVDGTNWERLVGHVIPNAGELTFTLDAGDNQWIDIKADSLNGHVTTEDLDIVVDAVKVNK